MKQVLPDLKETGQRTKGRKNTAQVLENFNALKYQKKDSIKTFTVKQQKVFTETDVKFVDSLKEIVNSRASVLEGILQLRKNNLTDLQCQQINFKARLHAAANIVNINSDKNECDLLKQPTLRSLFCKCGCGRFKGKKFPLCVDMQTHSILGSGILLFFLQLKALTVNILIFTLIYALFSLATNLLGNRGAFSESECTSSYCYFRDNASEYNKKYSNYLAFVQSWLGLAATVVWCIAMRFVKFYGTEKDKDVDEDLKSSSDFAVKLDNMPFGQYNEAEVLQYLQKICDRIQQKELQKQESQVQLKKIENSEGMHEQSNEQQRKKYANLLVKAKILAHQTLSKNKLKIKAIQIVYNMEFSRKMYDRILQLAQSTYKQLKDLGEAGVKVRDLEIYKKQKKELIESYELFQDLRKKFLTDGNFRKQIATSCCLVEFQHEQNKDVILQHFGHEKISILKKIKQKLKSCCYKQESDIIFKGYVISIGRAPQPSDILWTNCEQRQSTLRKILIYSITFLIILISFGIIVGLEYVQGYVVQNNSNSSIASNSNLITIINIITSLVLQVINKVLWFALFYLLNLEYNHTLTMKIVSQMNKSIFLMCINVIVLPIITNYVFGSKLYGANGLAGIVFDYHISAVTINMVLKLLDPIFLVLTAGLYIRVTRNWLIKFKYRRTEESSIDEESLMKNVYKLYEGPQFDIAEGYVFIITNIFHAAFFCPLQPFILILMTFQCFFYYWICKIRLLRFCKIPAMMENQIFDTATYLSILMPLFFGGGSIFISYAVSKVDIGRQWQYVGPSIVVGVAFLFYLNPGNMFGIITSKIANGIECLHPKKVLNEKKEMPQINQEEASEDQLKKEESKDITTRLQNYYKSSNSLTLLGFEKLLLNKSNTDDISNELVKYCQSHIPINRCDNFDEEEANKNAPEILNFLVNKGIPEEEDD